MNPYFIPNVQNLPQQVRQQNRQQFWQGMGEKAPGIIGGALAIGQQFGQMAGQDLGINTQTSPIQYDQSMMPIYTSGQLASDIGQANPQGASFGEIATATGQGAIAGSAFGPLGAAIGGAVGGIGSAVMGGVRKRRQRRQLKRATQQLEKNQQIYNEAESSFRANQNQLEDYNERMNSNNRYYNLYRNG
jgi:hypothetical protein